MQKIELKKETIKEIGKVFIDVFKIVVAVAIIAPLVKSESIGIMPFVFAFPLLLVGVYLTDKGIKDE